MCLTCYSYWKESESHQWPSVILQLTNTTSVGFQDTTGQGASKSHPGPLLHKRLDQMVFPGPSQLGLYSKILYSDLYCNISDKPGHLNTSST